MTWLVPGYLPAGASIGMQFTDITVWLAIAMTLSVFQISKVDEESEKGSVFMGCVSIVFNLSDPSLVHSLPMYCQLSTEIQMQDQSAVQECGRAYPTTFVMCR